MSEQGRPRVDSEFDWAECYTPAELSAALDLHAARAQKRGEYAVATEIRCAAVALIDLHERIQRVRTLAARYEVLGEVTQ